MYIGTEQNYQTTTKKRAKLYICCVLSCHCLHTRSSLQSSSNKNSVANAMMRKRAMRKR